MAAATLAIRLSVSPLISVVVVVSTTNQLAIAFASDLSLWSFEPFVLRD